MKAWEKGSEGRGITKGGGVNSGVRERSTNYVGRGGRSKRGYKVGEA